MTAREKFKLGDRVRMNAAGLRRPRQARVPTTGRVVGFGRAPTCVYVLRDGRRNSVACYSDWWDVDKPRARDNWRPG